MNTTEFVYPKKLVMIEQAEPWRKVTFTQEGDGYHHDSDNSEFKWQLHLTKKGFQFYVVKYNERNYKITEVEQ